MDLQKKLEQALANNGKRGQEVQFEAYLKSGKLDGPIKSREKLLSVRYIDKQTPNLGSAAFGLVGFNSDSTVHSVTQKRDRHSPNLIAKHTWQSPPTCHTGMDASIQSQGCETS